MLIHVADSSCVSDFVFELAHLSNINSLCNFDCKVPIEQVTQSLETNDSA